jgi:CBS domain-containing protein
VIAASARERRKQHLFPIVDESQSLVGVVTRNRLEEWLPQAADDSVIADIANRSPVVAYGDEPLRAVVYRMATTGLTRFPVIEAGDDRRLIGMVSLADLLKGRAQTLDSEERRERVLSLRVAFPFGDRFSKKEP